MKRPRRRIEVNLEELDRVLDEARQAPLSEEDHRKLREALHAMAAMLVRSRNTETTRSVVGKPEEEAGDSGRQPDPDAPPPAGHGRNGAAAFSGAKRVEMEAPDVGPWRSMSGVQAGERIQAEGAEGTGFSRRQVPLAGTVYSLERLRCGACGQVFTAQEPEGAGEEKYDESPAAMIAQLKYGGGTPFHRVVQLQKQLGYRCRRPRNGRWSSGLRGRSNRRATS